MSKHTNAWKEVEREHARRLHSEAGRTGPTGLDLPDSVSLRARLAVESKCRKDVPGWLQEAMQQSEDNMQRWNSRETYARRLILPVVVLHQLGYLFDTDLVVLRLADFEAQILELLEAKHVIPVEE